jgi:hypothetical protein
MKEEHCGNDGRGAAVENSRLALWVVQARHRVSHRRPPPLEIANDAISTFPQRRLRFYLSKSQRQNQTCALRAPRLAGIRERRNAAARTTGA